MNDLEFVQKCIQRDKHAWDEFVNKFSRLIYSYLNQVLRSNNPEVPAETINEFFQEFFIFLSRDDFAKLKSFKGRNGCSFASWLRQVVVHFAIDRLRKKSPEKVSLDQENEEGLFLKDVLEDPAIPAQDILIHKEKMKSLKDCIGALDSKDKYFIQMSINQGLELSALVKLFNLSRAALDMRKSRVIQKLRDCFKLKGFMLDF